MLKLTVFYNEGDALVLLPIQQVIYIQVFRKSIRRECKDGIERDVFMEVVAPGGAFLVTIKAEAETIIEQMGISHGFSE